MQGFGNQIKSFTVDGKSADPVLGSHLQGRHSVKIVLADNRLQPGKMNNVENYISPDVPAVTLAGKILTWNPVAGTKQYKVLKNGKEAAHTSKTSFPVADENYGEYQVIAVDANGVESFASEPLIVADKTAVSIYEIEKSAGRSDLSYKGFSGEGFVEISKTRNTALTIPVNIDADGIYAIDFKYANGNGPTNTENKCAIRTLKEGSTILGIIVLPQRGKDEWSNWGWSNPVLARFTKGNHDITISFETYNENMNGEINQAMLDNMRLIKIK